MELNMMYSFSEVDNDSFKSTMSNKEKFLINLVFQEKTYIQNNDDFEKIDLDDKNSIIRFICKVKSERAWLMLQNLDNVMSSNDVWNPYVILEIADKIKSVDQTFNKISEENMLLEHNCITPLVKTIPNTAFSWEMFKETYSVHHDVAKACEVFELEPEELSMYLEDIRGGIVRNYAIYKIMKYPHAKEDHLARFKNDSDYLEILQSAFYSEFPDVVEKYVGLLPNSVMSVLLVYCKAGCNIKVLEAYEHHLGEDAYWTKYLEFNKKIVKENEPLTKEIIFNLLQLHQILYGSYLEMYGDEPVFYYIGKLLTTSFNKHMPTFPTRQHAFDFQRSIYLVNPTNKMYRVCEANIPYIWERLEKFIHSMNSPVLKDCDITYRALKHHANIKFTSICWNTKSIVEYGDVFKPFTILEILELLDLEQILKMLKEFENYGNQISCHDPYLLFSLNFLIKNNFDYKKWVQLYITDPLMFSYCFVRTILAYLNGAEDYEKLFNTQNPEWFTILNDIAPMLNENYNLASACLLYLAHKCAKEIEWSENIYPSLDFPGTIELISANKESVTFDLYKVLNNPIEAIAQFRKTLYGTIACRSDNDGNVYVCSTYGEV